MSERELTLNNLLAELSAIESEMQTVSNRLSLLRQQVARSLPAEETPPARAEAAAPTAPAVEAPAPVTTPAEAAPPAEPPISGPLLLFSSSVSSEEERRNLDLAPNGVNPEGKKLLEIDARTAAGLAKGNPDPKILSNVLKKKNDTANQKDFGSLEDPRDLTRVRWAIVVSALEDAAVLKALDPLIRHRSEQQGSKVLDLRFSEGQSCGEWFYDKYDESMPWQDRPPVLLYRPGEKPSEWLARHGTSHGPVDAKMGVPYYLMIVGRPGPLNADDEAFVPFDFQYEIDIFWAVGRLCFTDLAGRNRLQDYTTYAERVVAWEKLNDAASRLNKETVLFGTRHDLDRSTERSADELVTPLSGWHSEADSLPATKGFGHQVHLAGAARRDTLGSILRGGNGGKPPALLFTATHGMGYDPNSPDLIANQGGLVCADWSGNGPIKRDWLLSGSDLDDSIKVEGMIALLFACYGAGTPHEDEFIFDEKKRRPLIAPFPFVAQLPQQLLVRGCLAILGHVERAWTYSFSSTAGAKSQTQGFRSVLGRLMDGLPAGEATDQFNMIQGARAAELVAALENLKFGKRVPDLDLATLWMARNDARNYALLGDPVVRLPY